MSAEGGLLARFPTALVLVLPRLLANIRARLEPGAERAPHLPIALDNGYETLASFTDWRGHFSLEDVALPTCMRSLEGFRLRSGREQDESVVAALSANDGPDLLQVPRGATRDIGAPITIQGPAVLYLANFPGTYAAPEFINAIEQHEP